MSASIEQQTAQIALHIRRNLIRAELARVSQQITEVEKEMTHLEECMDASVPPTQEAA